jgi:hypothetical protein
MTYQMGLCGADGVVIASDRCEFYQPDFSSPGVRNKVDKVRLSGEFAWAYYGGELSAVFSKHLKRSLDSQRISEKELFALMPHCAETAIQEWRSTSSGSSGKSGIILACGSSKNLYRGDIAPAMNLDPMREGFCVAGLTTSLSAFVPTRYHSRRMLVASLAALAAYSIRAAHDLDSGNVDGLDLAISDSSGEFHFANADAYWNQSVALDEAVRNCFEQKAI